MFFCYDECGVVFGIGSVSTQVFISLFFAIEKCICQLSCGGYPCVHVYGALAFIRFASDAVQWLLLQIFRVGGSENSPERARGWFSIAKFSNQYK